MKKKIGLVTFYKSNYGSLLQCFSTKKFVESIGCTCDIIDSEIKNEPKRKKIIKVIRHPSIFFHYLKLRKAHRIGRYALSKKTKELLDDFSEKFFSPKLISDERKKSVGEEYDKFIVGSDQIWNVDIKVDAFNFLQFAAREKRSALAVSFGVSQIPGYNQKEFRKALDGFDYISVREETGLDIVKKYSNAKVCRVADPTFIYNADEWRKNISDAVSANKKYILIHFLNEPNNTAVDSLNWLSKHDDLDVVAIGYKHKSFSTINRLYFMDGGPWEYVAMIDKAEYVLTDSFHTTLFSINFDKSFFTFPRQYSASKRSCRITDLLKRFGIENRLIDSMDKLKEIYHEKLPSQTRSILEHERYEIRRYIQEIVADRIPCIFSKRENYG